MNNEVFSFTLEQKAKLEKWKAFLDSEQAKQWAVWEKEAVESLHTILEQAAFREGNDLSPEQLDDVFRDVRELINNQALNKTLCTNNGLANFNSRLRRLFFSSEPFAERVDQFMELKGVGIVTVSQFLCALAPREYPEVTRQTLDVLSLDSTQLNMAYRQAVTEHNISSPQDYRDDTIEYLSDIIIFREIKNLLNVDLYTRVNHILWLAYEEEGLEVKPPVISVSLERDLRDFLAGNPDLIEKGLSVVGKEYDISGAGRVDLVCKDKRGNYVVIETKKGRESDQVVGQILRYIGGLRKEGKKARGIIIVNEPDEKLGFAIEAVKDFIKLKYYKVKFEITDSYTGTLD